MSIATRIPPAQWAIGQSYTWTDDKIRDRFESGFINECVSPATAKVRDFMGRISTIILNTPLCSGCDEPVRNGVCDECEVVFLDVPVIALADGWQRIEL